MTVLDRYLVGTKFTIYGTGTSWVPVMVLISQWYAETHKNQQKIHKNTVGTVV